MILQFGVLFSRRKTAGLAPLWIRNAGHSVDIGAIFIASFHYREFTQRTEIKLNFIGTEIKTVQNSIKRWGRIYIKVLPSA